IQRDYLRAPFDRLPWFRKAKPPKVKSAYDSFKNTNVLDANPLMAVQTIYDRWPDAFFLHQPYTENQQFLAGITSQYALDSAIINGFRFGIALDSTWRHVNNNGHPLTFVTTTNDAQRMTPDTSTLADLLQAGKAEVEQRAREIIKQQKKGQEIEVNDFRTSTEMASLGENAARIVADSSGWTPGFGMIDKDTAERNALREVFGKDFCIRLCQFHLKQAMRRWQKQCTIKIAGPRKGGQQALPKEAMESLLRHVEVLQRCPRESDWEEYVSEFNRKVRKLVLERYSLGEAMCQRVLSYFEDNWFDDRWRDMWVDYGLPDGATRDGILNTNNFIERAFKTFKTVFLGGRKNRRIDRLILVLVNDFFPFYALWPPNDAKPSRVVLSTMKSGYEIWKCAVFREEEISSGLSRCWITRAATQEELRRSPAIRTITTVIEQYKAEGTTYCPCKSIARKSEGIGKFDPAKRKPEDEARAVAEEAMLKEMEQQGDLEFQQDWVFPRDTPEEGQELMDDGPDAGSYCRPSSEESETDKQDGKHTKTRKDARSMTPRYAWDKEMTSGDGETDTDTDNDSRSHRGRQSPSFKLPVITGGKGRTGFMINSPVHKGRKSKHVGYKSDDMPLESASDDEHGAFKPSSTRPEAGGAMTPDVPAVASQTKPRPSKRKVAEKVRVLVKGRMQELEWPPPSERKIGFNNTDSVCYANALFQVLVHMPIVLQGFHTTGLPSIRTRSTSLEERIKTFADLYVTASDSCSPALWGYDHTTAVGGVKRSFNIFKLQLGHHQCAAELLQKLLDSSESRPEMAWLVTDVFGINVRKDYSYLDVPLGGGAVGLNTRGMIMAAFAAQTRQKKQCASIHDTFQTGLRNSPPYLVARINRDAELDAQRRAEEEKKREKEKLKPGSKSKVNVPKSKELLVQKTITIHGVDHPTIEKLTYNLVAAVIHSGSQNGGHYTAEVLIKNDWYRFNDTKVRSTFPGPFGKSCNRSYVDEKALPQPSPYLLFYQLRTPVESASGTQLDTGFVEDEEEKVKDKATEEGKASARPPFLADHDDDEWTRKRRIIPAVRLLDPANLESYHEVMKMPSKGRNGHNDYLAKMRLEGAGPGWMVSNTDAWRFKTGEMANDEMINAWGRMLDHHCPPGLARVPPTFLWKYTRSTIMLQRLTRWFKDVILFATPPPVRRLILPMHHGCHWTVGVVDFVKETVVFMDSITCDDRYATFKEDVEAFLEFQYTHEAHMHPSDIWQKPSWTFERAEGDYVPQQKDGNSCGFIVMRNMELAAMGLRPSESFLNLGTPQITKEDGAKIRMDAWLKMKEFGIQERNRRASRDLNAEASSLFAEDDDEEARVNKKPKL
ncbi:hypothetical protein QFC20_002696, partial [Naganishia adeliensis]